MKLKIVFHIEWSVNGWHLVACEMFAGDVKLDSSFLTTENISSRLFVFAKIAKGTNYKRSELTCCQWVFIECAI